MFIVITGNPNVGKSSIISHLNNKGYLTYNVDKYVHEIYQRDRIGYALIKHFFGDEYVNDVQVDKIKLKQLVINDKESYEQLKRLIWPLIKEQLKKLKYNNKYLIVEMAIYKIDPNYFDNIFDFVIEIKRDLNKVLNNNKLNTFFHNNSYKVDFIIKNNWTWEYAISITDQLFNILKIKLYD